MGAKRDWKFLSFVTALHCDQWGGNETQSSPLNLNLFFCGWFLPKMQGFFSNCASRFACFVGIMNADFSLGCLSATILASCRNIGAHQLPPKNLGKNTTKHSFKNLKGWTRVSEGPASQKGHCVQVQSVCCQIQKLIDIVVFGSVFSRLCCPLAWNCASSRQGN